jgi:hypothetical protein
MAYDADSERGYRVYVREGETYAPYLVLTNDYGGQILLLREHLLDEPRAYGDGRRNSAAYGGSEIDEFLNGAFLALLGPVPREKIVESDIAVTAPSALGVTGTETVQMTRKVFLLSYTEIGMPASSVIPAEGEALAFFETAERRVARFADGTASSWWLRSVDTWYDNVAIGVGPDASVGGGGVSTPGGVRPAFCVGRETAVAESGDVLPDRKVYVLA